MLEAHAVWRALGAPWSYGRFEERANAFIRAEFILKCLGLRCQGHMRLDWPDDCCNGTRHHVLCLGSVRDWTENARCFLPGAISDLYFS
jgi:hypothetical protein